MSGLSQQEILQNRYEQREVTVVSAQGQMVKHQGWLDAYIAALGSNIRMFLPFLESDPPVTAGYITDAGPRGHHFTSLVALDTDPRIRGMMLAYALNGTDEGLNLPDHADFTFGNGAADSVFSVGCWFNASTPAAAIEGLIGRYDSLAATNLEWRLFLDAAGKVNFVLHDDGVPASIGRLFNTAVTAKRWYFVVGTYDATEADTGIDIYLATATSPSITTVDDTNNSAGVYVAMEDKTVLTSIGYTVDAGAGNAEWFEGEMWGPFVVAEELSASKVSNLFRIGKKLLGF